MRHESTDRAGRIGSVDGIFTAGQRHGRRSHRVMRGAAWNDARQPPVVAPNRCWRRPRRLDVLAIDGGRAGPLHAGAANAHRIADRFACTNKVIKTAFAGADDDRSRHITLHRTMSPWACAGPGAKANAAMVAATAAESMIFLRIVTFPYCLLLTAPLIPPSQQGSTQAHSNRSSLFLSNETAIGLRSSRLSGINAALKAAARTGDG